MPDTPVLDLEDMRQILMRSFARQETGARAILDSDMRRLGLDPEIYREQIRKRIEVPGSNYTPEGYYALPYLALCATHSRPFTRYHVDWNNWRLTLSHVPETNFTRWVINDNRFYWLAILRSRFYRAATEAEIEQLRPKMKKASSKL